MPGRLPLVFSGSPKNSKVLILENMFPILMGSRLTVRGSLAFRATKNAPLQGLVFVGVRCDMLEMSNDGTSSFFSRPKISTANSRRV